MIGSNFAASGQLQGQIGQELSHWLDFARARVTKSKTIIKDQEIEVMTMSVYKRKLILLPKFMGASQKHPFLLVLFIKEFKNMGKHSKYSGYKLSFF